MGNGQKLVTTLSSRAASEALVRDGLLNIKFLARLALDRESTPHLEDLLSSIDAQLVVIRSQLSLLR